MSGVDFTGAYHNGKIVIAVWDLMAMLETDIEFHQATLDQLELCREAIDTALRQHASQCVDK